MQRPPWTETAAGLLAAGVALAGGELTAAILGAQSLVVAVADRILELAPGEFLRFGVETFAGNDKPALLISIALVALLLGAVLAPLAARSPRFSALTLGAFGVVAFLAEDAEGESFSVALLIGTAAAAAGYATFRLLLNAARETAFDPYQPSIATPGRATGSRRRFLAFAATAAAGASAAAVIARRIEPSVDVARQRASITLPAVDNAADVSPAGLEVDGLSPLVTPIEDFYRIDTAFVVPRVDAATWTLKVRGMVATALEFGFDELLTMPAIEQFVTLSCVSNEVGGDLVGNAVWRGVLLSDILERAGVEAGATQIVGRSVDGFTVGFPTAVALDGRAAMVAYAMNGEPLTAVHGFPARLVVPGLYGYVSATKWLAEIELTTLEAFDAYWVPRGWAKQAAIKTQSRIDTPRSGRSKKAGRVPVAGVAWGGIRGVSRVDVRITPDGATDGEWHEARLGTELSSSSWRQWVVDDWDASPGEYRLEVRATDGEGAPQTDQRRGLVPDGATGWHRVSIRIEA